MSAKIISGTRVAREIRDELKGRVAGLARDGLVPGLATVLAGDDGASRLYVGMKNKAAAAAGIRSRQVTLSGSTSEADLLALIGELNADPQIHGILVQLPLPKQIDSSKVLLAIDPEKDVDGFHPVNVGRLATGDPDVLVPCTPRGIIELLLRSGNDPAGKHVVVVGRSNIVGKPMARASAAQNTRRKRNRDRRPQPYQRPRGTHPPGRYPRRGRGLAEHRHR